MQYSHPLSCVKTWATNSSLSSTNWSTAGARVVDSRGEFSGSVVGPSVVNRMLRYRVAADRRGLLRDRRPRRIVGCLPASPALSSFSETHLILPNSNVVDADSHSPRSFPKNSLRLADDLDVRNSSRVVTRIAPSHQEIVPVSGRDSVTFVLGLPAIVVLAYGAGVVAGGRAGTVVVA